MSKKIIPPILALISVLMSSAVTIGTYFINQTGWPFPWLIYEWREPSYVELINFKGLWADFFFWLTIILGLLGLFNKTRKHPFSIFYPRKTVFHSKINGEIVLVEFFSKKTLYVKGAPQSGGEFVFMWQRVIEKIKDRKVKNCLILGVGGGTIIHILKKIYPNISITGVEIDPIMLEVAQKYFDLTPEVIDDIIIADAHSWVEKYKEKQSFDLIVADLFIGKLNPLATRQKKYLLKLKNLLTQSGMILYNAHYQPQEPLEFKKFVKTCKSIFREVEEVFHFPYNRVLLLE